LKREPKQAWSKGNKYYFYDNPSSSMIWLLVVVVSLIFNEWHYFAGMLS